ncbi:MAG: PDZ domain-containing protein [Candidatus Eremiobacteraeota bacterium]|nr:PDZ domain-containing protein [Candidatus Eremiobacteraeota bacterium]
MTQGYYRYPTIAGENIVFVCEDDIWSGPATGGVAHRLTVSFGTCTTPRLSPDGTSIAFVSNDDGNPEIYVMPAAGGQPQRLTFLGATAAQVVGWTSDGLDILFVANPRAWYEGETRPFTIAKDGGEAREGNLGHGRSFSYGPGGAMVLGRNAVDAARWKRYRGGTAGEIWIDVAGTGEFERFPAPDGNPTWPMWIGDRIYFVSDHEGIGNLYSALTDGSDLQRATHEAEYYVRFPSTDGKRIVYFAGGALACYDVSRGTVAAIEIETPSAAPQSVRRFEGASESLEDFSPHPDGTRVAFVSRGQAFAMPLFDGPVSTFGDGSRSRVRHAQWSNDGESIVCVTDHNGYEQIARYCASRSAEPKTITSGDIGRVTDLAIAPSGDTIAFANHRHELCLLENGTVRTIDTSPARRIGDLAFSPDGRYLAYVWWPASGTSIIRIAKVKSAKVHDITAPLRADHSPAWDPEGKYLYFISTRDFNPVYDALQFDLSFPQAQRPFVVTLRSDVPSPFVPVQKPVHRETEHERGDQRERDEKADEKRRALRIEIDFDGIAGRILGFPVDEGDYQQIVAIKNRVFYTAFPVRGIKHPMPDDDEDESGTLYAYDFEQLRQAVVANDVSEIRLGLDEHTLIYRSGDRLRAIDAQNELGDDEPEKPSLEPGRKSGWLDLDRASVAIVPRDEWAQMYREAWRLQTEQFWVEDMSDIDWDKVYDRYKAVLPRVRTRTELSDLIWEMHGELGTSHAYEYGGDHRVPPQYQRGFLGADLAWNADRGGYTIERIYRGDSWNRESDAPLAEPGLDIHEGDTLLAIGGKRLSREISPGKLLVNSAGKDIAITVRAAKNGERTVMVRALASEATLRYRAWVEANRTYVREKTGGRVGYIHIPDMGPWGFAEFHRGYLSEFDRSGLLVDVRYNRGGHVSPLLLEKLGRKRVGYDLPRYGAAVPYPPESVGGPMVALTNQFAGSDGDIFSHCFKLYGLGPLVGKRTWGGVIGIEPYHHLVDGTLTTQPEYSFWFIDVGWKVENYGTDPDYDVDISPQDYREGRDPQMDFALRLMERSLESAQSIRPDLSTRPSLSLPTLG